jgi:hypothetical protein
MAGIALLLASQASSHMVGEYWSLSFAFFFLSHATPSFKPLIFSVPSLGVVIGTDGGAGLGVMRGRGSEAKL